VWILIFWIWKGQPNNNSHTNAVQSVLFVFAVQFMLADLLSDGAAICQEPWEAAVVSPGVFKWTASSPIEKGIFFPQSERWCCTPRWTYSSTPPVPYVTFPSKHFSIPHPQPRALWARQQKATLRTHRRAPLLATRWPAAFHTTVRMQYLEYTDGCVNK
jgi:hypothetical protein